MNPEAGPKCLEGSCLHCVIGGMWSGLDDADPRFPRCVAGCLGWDYPAIEDLLLGWNKKNKEELKKALITGQVRYHKQKKQKILPPNCRSYYQDFQVCTPDHLCEKIKNPVQYSKRKVYFLNKKTRTRLTEEQKEMRRKFRQKKNANKKKGN